MNFGNIDWPLIGEATIDTLLMTGFSLLFTVIIGLPLGIILFLTSPRQMLSNAPVYQVLSFIVNVLRSVPFLILLIVMIPLTRVLAGTSLGVEGAIPPLVASAAPFFARLVENVLRELDPGVAEACRAAAFRLPALSNRRHDCYRGDSGHHGATAASFRRSPGRPLEP